MMPRYESFWCDAQCNLRCSNALCIDFYADKTVVEIGRVENVMEDTMLFLLSG